MNLISQQGKIKIVPISFIVTLLYVIIIFVVTQIKPSLILPFAFLFPLSLLLFFQIYSNISFIFMIYIGSIPLVQHFNISLVDLGGFVITPHMILNFILLLGLLQHFVYTFDSSNKYILTKLDLILFVFFLFSVISLIFTFSIPIDQNKRFLLFYAGIIEPIIFYFMIIFILRRESESFRYIIWGIILASFCSLFVAILELKAIGFSFVELFIARMRIGYGYHNTNLFGIHAVLVFPILFYSVQSKLFERKKFLVWSSFLILIVLSILTFNRGTFIAILFQLLLLFTIKENRKIIYKIFISGILVAAYFNEVIIFYIYRFIGGHGTEQSQTLLDLSAMYRLAIWELGAKLLYLYPLGVGGGGFQWAWEQYGFDSSIYFGTPHQLFLHIGVDYGTFSMIAFIIMLIIAYKMAGNAYRSSKDTPYINIFKYFQISLVGYVIQGLLTTAELSHLTGFTWPNNGYTLIFMVILAIISFSDKIGNKN